MDDVGGPSYLSSLVDNIPTAANAVHYAKIVRERSILRKTIAAATDIINKGYENEKDINDVLDFAEASTTPYVYVP